MYQLLVIIEYFINGLGDVYISTSHNIFGANIYNGNLLLQFEYFHLGCNLYKNLVYVKLTNNFLNLHFTEKNVASGFKHFLTQKNLLTQKIQNMYIIMKFYFCVLHKKCIYNIFINTTFFV